MSTRFGDAISDAITQGMATYAAERGLPSLHWSLGVQSPQVSLMAHAGRADFADHERVTAAELWAITDEDEWEEAAARGFPYVRDQQE